MAISTPLLVAGGHERHVHFPRGFSVAQFLRETGYQILMELNYLFLHMLHMYISHHYSTYAFIIAAQVVV